MKDSSAACFPAAINCAVAPRLQFHTPNLSKRLNTSRYAQKIAAT
jgi:hypothetical protein